MEQMIVRGYKIKIINSGWSFANLWIYKKMKILRLLKLWIPVWESHGRIRADVEKYHPDELRDWAEMEISSYEDYTSAWEKELQKTVTKNKD